MTETLLRKDLLWHQGSST